MVNPEQIAAARALKPIYQRQALGRSVLLFDGVDRQQLAAIGEVRTPSLADLFVAVMSNHLSTTGQRPAGSNQEQQQQAQPGMQGRGPAQLQQPGIQSRGPPQKQQPQATTGRGPQQRQQQAAIERRGSPQKQKPPGTDGRGG